MAKFFGLLKKADQLKWLDTAIFGLAGAALLMPDVVAPITGFALGPVSVLMLVGALAIARAVDMYM